MLTNTFDGGCKKSYTVGTLECYMTKMVRYLCPPRFIDGDYG